MSSPMAEMRDQICGARIKEFGKFTFEIVKRSDSAKKSFEARPRNWL